MKEECIQVWKKSVFKYGRGVYTSMEEEFIQVCMEEECIQVWKRSVYKCGRGVYTSM